MYERDYEVGASIQDAFKVYRRDYGYIEKKLYTAIAYDITKTISDMIVRESLEYKIPGLGFLRIKRIKTKLKIRDGRIDLNKNIIDWKATLEYWKEKYKGLSKVELKQIKDKRVIFQINDHTNGEVMRWYWDKLYTVKNLPIYSFRPVKGGIFENKYYTGRLGLASWIKDENKNNEYYY